MYKRYQLIIFDWEGPIGDSKFGRLFPGAFELIQRLYNKKFILAIATNKSQMGLKQALQSHVLSEFFAVTRASGQVPPKPCPQMLQEILAAVNVDASAALMIGDSVHDIQMAKSAGIDAIGVDFYHCHRHALSIAGALGVFNDYAAVEKFLEKLEKNV